MLVTESKHILKMANLDIKELLDSGVHFGHLTRKWNPNMANVHLHTERNGVHHRLV